ncbi:hypothetical protein [Amycolatopsis echigonensis]|uniref:Uncharacterized protein n=1 Tax=Amycolatopsis echigonensis TaxID=2576905 RepID=A0A8E2B8N2_9PSEU|nr:hypothetical protein [Amycolatopsis echigonensis]MBB2504512.1 hypothetical protein [Amycolatopsis echigonensis]
MNDEVSVAELLVREGHERRIPPPSRSRWRMVAVMLAVIVGCGAAAMLVSYGTTANDGAARITEMRVIEMPDRTGGAGGVDETNPPTPTGEETQEGTVGVGDAPSTQANVNPFGETSSPAHPADSAPAHPSSSERPETTGPTRPTEEPSSSASTPSSSSQPSTSSSHAPPCVLSIICL